MNASELQKARIDRVDEIHAEFNLASHRTHMRILRNQDIDTQSDRWAEYVICRPFWSTHWYPKPPPAMERKLV